MFLIQNKPFVIINVLNCKAHLTTGFTVKMKHESNPNLTISLWPFVFLFQ